MLGVNENKGENKSEENMMNSVGGEESGGKKMMDDSSRIDKVELARICSEELAKSEQESFSIIDRNSKASTSSTSLRMIRNNQNGANSNNSNAPCPFESTCPVAKDCRSNAGRAGLMATRLAETYYGYVETVEDAVMIVEACRFGRLMRVKRRLLEKERQGIRSGSVFVFVERESGIRRWTDGKVWSPSRICGEFLIYRELESRQAPANRKPQTPVTPVNWTEQVARILAAKTKAAAAALTSTSSDPNQRSSGMEQQVTEPAAKTARIERLDLLDNDEDDDEEGADVDSQEITAEAANHALASIRQALAEAQQQQQQHQKALLAQSATSADQQQSPSTGGSAPRSMIFKKDGLIKKTISLTVADETYHLICYFKDSNLGSELLHLTPSRMGAFKNLDICRNPVSYPIMMLQPGHGLNGGTTNPLPPPPSTSMSQTPTPQINGVYNQEHPTVYNRTHYQQSPYGYASHPPVHTHTHTHSHNQQQHHYHQQHQIQQQQQQPQVPLSYQHQQYQQQQGRRILPFYMSTSNGNGNIISDGSIANGSVQLPPVLLKSKHPTIQSNPEPSSSMTSIDLENLPCGAGACNQNGCPSAGKCNGSASKARQDESQLEEEQLLFYHFLESVRNEHHNHSKQ